MKEIAEQANEPPPNASPSPPLAENKIADPSPYKSQQTQQNTIVGATSNSKQAANDKNDNEKQKELSAKLVKAKTNKLHDYTSSTYRITMYLLSGY